MVRIWDRDMQKQEQQQKKWKNRDITRETRKF